MTEFLRTALRSRVAVSGPDFGPVLVSELPGLTRPGRPTVLHRLRAELVARRSDRVFERAVRHAGPAEHTDLLAARRR